MPDPSYPPYAAAAAASGCWWWMQIRRDRERVGVVFLTAPDRTEDVIAGPTVGGDVSKPFGMDEVVALVRAVLRRLSSGVAACPLEDGVLRVADLELDEEGHEVRRASVPNELSLTEFALRRYLMEDSGRAVTAR